MPRLLELFEQEQVRGTFFITGDMARRFPNVVTAIRDAGHEVGCHGDTHTPFDTLDEATARKEIQASSAVLREFAQLLRSAPNLRFPDSYVRFCGRGRLPTRLIAGEVQEDVLVSRSAGDAVVACAGFDDVVGIAHSAHAAVSDPGQSGRSGRAVRPSLGIRRFPPFDTCGSTAASAPGQKAARRLAAEHAILSRRGAKAVRMDELPHTYGGFPYGQAPRA